MVINAKTKSKPLVPGGPSFEPEFSSYISLDCPLQSESDLKALRFIHHVTPLDDFMLDTRLSHWIGKVEINTVRKN